MKEQMIIQLTCKQIKDWKTLHFFSSDILFATSKLMGSKYRVNKKPPESEIQRWIIAKLEVYAATVVPIMKKGTPAHIKNVITNKNNATMINIRFFLITCE
ncbi:hypothetical protein [Bacillus weihaiensis]|uniref:hypothetical protein n=1 Tax=Bacillus weihaiensis TaxID=1547283 RepID=UPI0023571AB0|nr:hypothetical protein [Bacillus weihaiensis]